MGVRLEQWRWAEQLVEAALELEVRAASVEEAGAEQQVHWAEAEWEVASWTQPGVSLEEQHLKEVVRRKVGQLKGDLSRGMNLSIFTQIKSSFTLLFVVEPVVEVKSLFE